MKKYVGEEGENCKLTATIVCANPWNLEVSNLALKRSFLGHELYLRALGSEYLYIPPSAHHHLESFHLHVALL